MLSRFAHFRAWSTLAIAAFASWLFVMLAFGLFGFSTSAQTIGRFDTAVMRQQAALRAEGLTELWINATALGSSAVMTWLVLFAVGLLVANRKFVFAAHIAVAAIGGGLLSQLFKFFFEKPRPEFLAPLVRATGYSFPSGHTLMATSVYLTLAVLAAETSMSRGARLIALVFALATASLVAYSRVYLGVHYPSDVLGGFTLGAAWTFFLAAGFAYFRESHTSRSSVTVTQ